MSCAPSASSSWIRHSDNASRDLSRVHDLEFKAQLAPFESRVVGAARGDAIPDRMELEGAIGQLVAQGGPGLADAGWTVLMAYGVVPP